MDRRLLRPSWVLAHIALVLLALLFARLGFWQLDRLEERRTNNEIGRSRLAEEPMPLEALVEEAGSDLSILHYRIGTAAGRYDPLHEVLIRSQVYLGTAGFHVVTPLVMEDGKAVLVNRGWVPLDLDTVPVEQAPPPGGEVYVEGWLAPSQTRPPLGPADPVDRQLATMSRVDIDRISKQVPYELEQVYLVDQRSEGSELPIVVEVPSFEGEGPHLGYAIQWFGFAAVGIIGYLFLVRRQLGRSS